MTSKIPTVYIPSLPSLSSEDLPLYDHIHKAHMDLVGKLAAAGYRVEDIDGQRSWLKNMMKHAATSDAFIFPPMTSLEVTHPRFKAEAAQRWFEFLSLVTGVHVGSRIKYDASDVAKPCVVIDRDGQWEMATSLLEDLHRKGMFSSKVEDIVHVVRGNGKSDYASLNTAAVAKLGEVLTGDKRKLRSQVRHRYSEDHFFKPFRNEIPRHPFGVAMFGSATTEEASYKEAAHALAKMIGKRGWRLSSGGAVDGCMGAMDEGFAEGKQEFNSRYPKAAFKPAHIGVSTQAILRLEGQPKNLDHLIITDNIYDRMMIIIRGQRVEDPIQRSRDATRVLFVVPGGTGTLHEFATLMQLATHGSMMEGRKIVLLNLPNHQNPKEGFWDPLITTAKRLGFDSLFEVARNPEEAIEIADKTYQTWLGRHPEHAALPHPVYNPNPTSRTSGSRVSGR